MFAIKAEATRLISDSYPDWVECRLVDSSGKEWLFREKIPVVYDADSDYPDPATLACEIVARRVQADGREVVTVDTELPWHIESTTGETRFDLFVEQLVEIG